MISPTAVYRGEESDLILTDPNPNTYEDIFIHPNGTSLFALSSTSNYVEEYAVITLIDYEENSTNNLINVDANDGAGGNNDANLSYSLIGPDAASFRINESGVVSFLSSPDFESPADQKADNTYEFSVTATNTSSTSIARFITAVTDIPDVPLFTTVGTGFSISGVVFDGNGKEF